MPTGSKPSGFTLLEVMVTLAVLGLVLVGALAAVSADLRATRSAVARLEAAALAEEILARLEILTPQQLETLVEGGAASFEPPLEHYRWQARAEPVVDDPGLLDVQVTILWQDGSLQVRTRSARSASVPTLHPPRLP